MGKKTAARWIFVKEITKFEGKRPSRDSAVSVNTLLVQRRLTVDLYCGDLALSV